MYLISAIPYLCILGAWVLAFWPRFIVSKEMAGQPGGYDNSDPRGQQGRLEGLGRRAVAAHQNGMENLAPFGIGVVAAMQRAVDVRVVAILSLAYLAARLGFVQAYLGDQPKHRSVLFSIGALICIILYICAAFGWPKF